MKVVHLCSMDFGGAGKAAYRLHKGLQKIDVDSCMIVMCKKTSDDSVYAIPSEVPLSQDKWWSLLTNAWERSLADYPSRSSDNELFSGFCSIISLEPLQEIIRSADIINLHWVAGLFDSSVMPQYLHNKKIIWTLHDMNPFTGGCHYAGECIKYYENCGACPQLASNNPDDLSFSGLAMKQEAYRDLEITVVTPSRWLGACSEKSSLLGRFSHKIIPYGFPLDTFKPVNRERVRSELNIPSDSRVVLFCADSTATKRKGFSYLLETLKLMSKSGRSGNLILAVAGLHDNKRQEIHGYPVLSFGHIGDEEQMALLYNAADVFVLPSLEDNLPNTVVEALASGTPVAAFNIGGVPDMIDHGITGYLAPARDVAGLADAIEWCINYAPAEIRQTCRAKAEGHFALEKQAINYKKLYDSIAITSVKQKRMPVIKKTAPKISIVTPSFNQAQYLEECIDSILSQNYPNLEYIIMDGGSTDGSVEIIKKYEKHLAYWQSKPDGGQYHAINEGFRRSTGEIMGWLNSDDKFHLNGLRVIADVFTQYPDVDFITGTMIGFDKHGEPTRWGACGQTWSRSMLLDKQNVKNYLFVMQEATYWRRDLWEKAGSSLNLSCHLAADFELWARFSRFTQLYSVDELIAGFRWYSSEQRSQSQIVEYVRECEHVIDTESKMHSFNPNLDSVCPELISYPIKASSVSISVRSQWPRISIVTPSYNQAEYLEECIESILSQNYPNLEYIIMDGGSTDGSVEIIKKYEKHLAYWQSKPDGGQYQAINEGFRRSTGEIMTWLNSDDKYHSGALQLVELAFRAMPQAEWITGRPTAWDDLGTLTTVFDHVPLWSQERLLFHGKDDYYIQQESTFWRRTLWDRAGGMLDTTWQLAADFELWCRFFHDSQLIGVDALLGGFRYHSGQKTDTMMNRYEQEVLQIIDRERHLKSNQSVQSRPPAVVVDMGEIISATTPKLTPDAFSYFSYSKRPHFNWFEASAKKIFGSAVHPDFCDLKMYQDLLCYTFIVDNLPKGSRILEVGGCDSRVLKALKYDYECWNIDKLEGLGNGLTEVAPDGYRMIQAYMGDFSEELPDGYFDFVFSISALEHVKENEENFNNICRDMDRVMKPEAFSLHCFDVVAKPDSVWTNSFLPFLFRRYETINRFTPFELMERDPSLYSMSESAYNRGWINITKVPYKDFGRPLSCNILWQKPLDQPVSILTSLEDIVPNLASLMACNGDAKKGKLTASAVQTSHPSNVVVATSIAPGNTERQQKAIQSWLDNGFKVISVNIPAEIELLQCYFPDVAFVNSERSGSELFGRPLVFLDDVFSALAATGASICGIINSDIHLRNDISIYDFVASEAKGSFICGHRYDVEDLSTPPGKLYLNGFDLFFFDTSVLDRLPPSPFCIGATWWDIWVPLAMILKNVTAKRIIAPLGFHELHTNKWDEQEWLRNSIRLVQLIDSTQFDLSGYPGFSARIKTLYEQCMPQGLYKLFRDFILEHTQLVAPEQMLPDGIDPILQEPSYLVSAIVSTYNAEEFFNDCMNNLIGQTLYEKGQLEIIIINSGSEQGEERIAQRFMESHDHMVYQRTERETLYAAWNRGIKLARGKYITHANTDDRHQPIAFERMAQTLDQHDVGLVYVDALMTTTSNENSVSHSAGKAWLLPDFNIRQALLDCPFGCQVMWKASVHEKVGMFDPGYKRAGDYEFFLRVGLKAGAMHLPEILALYHESPNNLSYQSPEEVIQEVNRFIGDYRRQLPLEIIYPYLQHDSSPLAKAAALVDFANNLMGISGFLFSDTQLAEALYRQALEILPHDTDILGNLIVACIVNGKAFDAHSLLNSVTNLSPRLAYYKELLEEGKSPALSLTDMEYPGLNAMPAVKTAPEIRVPWERPVIDPSVKTIIIDGVIFQLQYGRPFGISRMWLSLLTELGKGPLATRIILLDRVGTAPKIPGIQTRRIPVFHYGDAQIGSYALDAVCREENAELFLSTYYTYTNETPSLLMLYDMIPERFEKVGPVDAPPAWRDKYHAIVNSSAFAVISQSTAQDLDSFYPQTSQQSLTVIHCAVSDDFRVHSEAEIAAFKAVNGIDRPYFLLVGRRDPHKNVALFFQAFARLPNREQYAIFMAGGGNALEPDLRELAGPAAGYGGFFSDQDLSLAYSGAIALVYPSIYEGFGLPILEAMQSGCPVITCQNSSLPEVAGSAALYVGESDYEEMARALVSVQQPDVRGYLIKRGLERAQLFSWQKSAGLLEDAIHNTIAASGAMQMSGGK